MLRVNQVLKRDDEVYRILWLEKSIDVIYIINVNQRYMPVSYKLSSIENEVRNGALIRVEDRWINTVNNNDITTLEKKYRDRAWDTIEGIVYEEPYIYQQVNRRELILKITELKEVSESSVKRYLKRYWINGKTKNALIPHFNNCGGRGKEKDVSEKKRGRPRKNEEVIGAGVNIDKNMQRIFSAAINKYYNTSTRNSLKTTYELMVKDYFSNINENSIIEIQTNIPTLAQFKYWFYKKRNYKKEISSRYGSKRYDQRHRPIVGKTLEDVNGPATTYMIDATQADFYLVSAFNREWIVGRPTLYFVMDVFSRMIVGFYIGYESASHIAASMALLNCVQDKKEFCKKYDIEIEEDEWPISNLPDSILADRGEFEGKQIETLIENLGINVKLHQSYRPEMKSLIESNFHTMNTILKPLLPGVVSGNFRERGDKDYRLNATLTLKEVTAIIIKAIIYYNNNHVLDNYDRNEKMIEEGISSIPCQLWSWGIENLTGRLRVFPEEVVKLNLLPTFQATVTSRGIRFKGMYYNSQKIINEKWSEKARNKGVWKVDIAYDPRSLDYIYIKENDGRGYHKCFLLNHEKRYKDKCIEEVENLIEMEKTDKQLLKQKDLNAKVKLMKDVEEIVNVAKRKLPYTGDSNTKRLRGIEENRKIERDLNRKNEEFKFDDDSEEIVSNNTNLSNKVLNELELLKEKQRKGLGLKND